MVKKCSAKELYDDMMATYSIPDSFSRWENYREQVTEYIVQNTEPGKSIAVIGVGEGNDIDLTRIYEHCGSLTLMDINVKGMETAVERYGLKGMPDVRCIRCDLLGISEEEYLGLFDIVLEDLDAAEEKGIRWSPSMSVDKYRDELGRLYERINGFPVDIGSESFDYTVMVGVHSQLNSLPERIWSLFLEAAGYAGALAYEGGEIADLVRRENDIHIPRVNEALLRMTRESAFIGLERYELLGDHIVEGAYQALKDIDKRRGDGEVWADSFLQAEWPLRDGVCYEMCVIKCVKQTCPH